MTTCQTASQLDQCLRRARDAIVPMCRASAKRLRRDPEELISEILEKIFLRLASGQPIVNIVRYARRYARGYAKQACVKQGNGSSPLELEREADTTSPLDRLIASEECQTVREEIDALSDDDRRIVIGILNGEPPQRCYRDIVGRRMQVIARLQERLGRRGIGE